MFIWPLLPFISDLLWSCYILRNEVSDLVLALHLSLLLVAVLWSNSPFAVCPSLSFQACQLLFEYVPWSLREEGVLGFPGLSQSRAGASATKLPCDSTLGAEGREGQRPWALVGKGMGIKKWTKHHREENIRVAWYVAECMFDFATFLADVCRKQTDTHYESLFAPKYRKQKSLKALIIFHSPGHTVFLP